MGGNASARNGGHKRWSVSEFASNSHYAQLLWRRYIGLLIESCIFCEIPPEEAWIETEFGIAIPHPQPLAPCHVLVAPRRHVAAFYDLDAQEQTKLWAIVQDLRIRVSSALRTDGFAIGFADRKGAWHTHIHVVPRAPGEHLALPDDVEWVDADDQTAAFKAYP
jgi:diadenosine tetraphosphate (Ap4A) HIT family hydrolase